jgi:hypothetical protein
MVALKLGYRAIALTLAAQLDLMQGRFIGHAAPQVLPAQVAFA